MDLASASVGLVPVGATKMTRSKKQFFRVKIKFLTAEASAYGSLRLLKSTPIHWRSIALLICERKPVKLDGNRSSVKFREQRIMDYRT